MAWADRARLPCGVPRDVSSIAPRSTRHARTVPERVRNNREKADARLAARG